jgi:predicted amidophosphoribosyltransferase
MKINVRPIAGNWSHGWALDQHTLHSNTGDTDGFDPPALDPEQAGIGEAMFKLKFHDDLTLVEPIARTVAAFIRGRPELADIAAILPVPPSEWRRSYQPVEVVAARVGALLRLPAPGDYLLKTKPTRPLHGISDRRPRPEELNDAFSIMDKCFANRHVLLFDDIYRFGQTLQAATVALLFQGNVAMVSAITATSVMVAASPDSGEDTAIFS